MSFKTLDIVAIARDLPEHGLKEGDVGTVVEVYEEDGVEIEVVSAGGQTVAVVSLDVRDVRPVGEEDVFAVRRINKSA